MNLSPYLPIFAKLKPEEQAALAAHAHLRRFEKGALIHNGSDCMGLMLIISGQLRAFAVSDDGREITLYRLMERDLCLFSASCMMNSIRFDITITAEKDTEVILIPSDAYRAVMEASAPLANYTSEIMADRFSQVMWLIDQIMWKRFDSRLSEFLLNEAVLEGTDTLTVTHETIGNHLGSPREVVTRMLKYLASEGAVKLSRGTVQITDKGKLRRITEK